MVNGKPATGAYHKSDDALRDMQSQKEGAEFANRVATAQYVNAVFRRDFASYVHDRLKKQYNPETFAQMKVDVHTDVNVLADILAKLCRSWSEGATYTLNDDAGEYGDPDGAHSEFLAAAKLDVLGDALDVFTELHPRIAVGPMVCKQERSGLRVFRWAIHDPSTFNLVRDDDNPVDFKGLDTYGWCDHLGVQRRAKTAWRSEYVAEMFLNDRGKWETLSEDVNRYGVVPFVLFGGSEPSNSPWLPCLGEELADVTVAVCCAETVLANKSLAQVKVLAGEFKDFPRGQVLKQGGVIEVGNTQNISVLDYQVDTARDAEVHIQRPRRNALVSVGLSVDEFEQTGTPASGEALKMRYAARDRRAVNKRKFLRASMVELFWMAQHVLAYQMTASDDDGLVRPIAGIGSLIPYDSVARASPLRLSIDVNEVTYPELAAERAAAEDRLLQQGRTNLAELYMRDNPDVTDLKVAMAAVVRNRALNVRMGDDATMRRAGPVLARAKDGTSIENAVLTR